jgi:hypothetical protein
MRMPPEEISLANSNAIRPLAVSFDPGACCSPLPAARRHYALIAPPSRRSRFRLCRARLSFQAGRLPSRCSVGRLSGLASPLQGPPFLSGGPIAFAFVCESHFFAASRPGGVLMASRTPTHGSRRVVRSAGPCGEAWRVVRVPGGSAGPLDATTQARPRDLPCRATF